jgi:hypothetical protein
MIAKILILSGAAAAISPLAGTAVTAAADLSPAIQEGAAWDRQLSFTLAPSDDSHRDRVQLSLRHGDRNRQSQYGRTFERSELQGLSTADGPVRFRIAREAGTIDCDGTMRDGRGSGECRFMPDAGFAAELDRRGIGRPTGEQQFHLAMAGVGRPLLGELERQGYPRPRVQDLVALGIHGADVDYLRGLDSAGYRVGNLDKLVAFRIHGVTPAYIAELSALGGEFRDMAPDRLVEMRIHGVTPGFARAMTELGHRGLGPSELVAMRIHGVSEARVRELAAIGYRDLSADTLTQFAIHGVTPEYIRDMAAAGYRDLTVQQLVNLRIHGVRAADAAAINAAVAGRRD